MQPALALTALLGFAAGIALASLVSIPLSISSFIALLAAGFLATWYGVRRTTYLVIALFFLFFSLAVFRMAFVPHALPHTFARELGTKVSWSATVVSDPDVRENNQRIPVVVREGNAEMKVMVVTDRYTSFAIGDEVTVSGTPEIPDSFETDGGRTFNYRMFLAKDGVLALVPKAQVEKTGESKSVILLSMRMLSTEKHVFSRALEAALPEPHSSLAQGLLVGGKQGLGKALLDAFTIAGLLPIVVLSGYNVMIIANFIFALCAPLPRRYSLVLAGVTITAFVLAAGAGSSAIRAGIMAAIGLFAQATRRKYDALRALLAALVLMVLISPLSLVYDPGLQFSFMATLGLILASSSFNARLIRVKSTVLRDVLATTVAAQLFVLPLLLFETGNLSLLSIPANVLVLPVIPLTMALSAVGGFISLIIPSIATIVGLPAYAGLAYIIWIAETIARMPLAQVIVPMFPIWFLVPAYAGVAWITWRIRKAAPGGAASDD